jgi:hypothetical protein
MKPTWTTISGRTQWAQPRQPDGARERRRRDFQLVESRAQVEQQPGVEAGADLAREHEIVAVVVANEQRAEARDPRAASRPRAAPLRGSSQPGWLG